VLKAVLKALGVSSSNTNMMNCFQVIISISTCAIIRRAVSLSAVQAATESSRTVALEDEETRYQELFKVVTR